MGLRAELPALLLLLSAMVPQAGLGCRFNVRETGFVDLGIERYFVFCYVDREIPAADERMAERALRDSPVVFETVPVGRQDDHPALKYLKESKLTKLPALVLVSPDESTRVITALEEVVDSPFRKTIVDHVARHYGVVLIVEGADPRANAQAGQAAAEAAAAIEERMDSLPKPIKRGPVVLTLPRGSLARESLLLWSLGIDEEALAETHAAVLYGRVRRIGPVLRGDEITREVLYNILSVVGADCECGIDPSLFRGVGLPVRWDSKTQAAVAAELGFDPENPLIRTEVSQIMRLRATLYPWALSEREQRTEAIDDLPVPFVEDTENPALGNLLYTFAGIAGLALLGAVFLLLRASRRQS
ncbi:MAG: hypothetical protein GY953_14010 [bacterium]|nr:hypothetical protein [bacterium]